MLGRARDRSRARPAAAAAAAPAAWTPAALAPVGWWRGDMGVTLNGGDASAWADQGSTAPVLDFVQATGANQLLYTAANAALNNQATLTATTSSDWMGAGSAGDVNFVHDGTGCTIVLVARATVMGVTQYLMGSQGASLTALGFSIYLQNTDRINFVTGNGVASPIALMSSSSVSLNVPFELVIEYASALATDCTMFLNGVSVGTMNDATSPSSSNSATQLRLAVASAGFAFRGDAAEGFALNRVWTAGEKTSWGAYRLARYNF